MTNLLQVIRNERQRPKTNADCFKTFEQHRSANVDRKKRTIQSTREFNMEAKRNHRLGTTDVCEKM